MFLKEMESSLQGQFIQLTHAHFVQNFHQLMALGLHPGQMPMLHLLELEEGLSQKEIAEKLKVKPPTVTMSIRRMEKEGLIDRRPDERDQRVSRIFLTALGRERSRKVKALFLENEKVMFRGFSQQERELLSQFFHRMQENLQRAEPVKKRETGKPERETADKSSRKEEGEDLC